MNLLTFQECDYHMNTCIRTRLLPFDFSFLWIPSLYITKLQVDASFCPISNQWNSFCVHEICISSRTPRSIFKWRRRRKTRYSLYQHHYSKCKAQLHTNFQPSAHKRRHCFCISQLLIALRTQNCYFFENFKWTSNISEHLDKFPPLILTPDACSL